MENFIMLLLITAGIFSILALGLNLIAGYTGLLSLCQAAFFGIGSYTTAICMMRFSMSFWTALVISGVLAALFGILIGLPTLRLKGDYLAIATLGFGEIVKNVILNLDAVTRGPMGINGIPAPTLFGFTLNPIIKIHYVILVWIMVALTFLALRRIINSRFGRALESIREDEIAASAMGINTTKYKIVSFSIGAFFAGIGGALWAAYNQTISPGTYDFMLSIMILCMIVLGGLGNNVAALVGTVIIVIASGLPRLLGFSSFIPPQVNQIFFGLILVVMMIFRPQGILGMKKINFGLMLKKRLEGKHDY